ncbi:hypothetical protein DFJ74DRAFT_655045 [Hyaloraphidium curvatum]|nr:hypothetical protein DFJ74DRAFT_655045 [Hyaloraphidium curvatum]
MTVNHEGRACAGRVPLSLPWISPGAPRGTHHTKAHPHQATMASKHDPADIQRAVDLLRQVLQPPGAQSTPQGSITNTLQAALLPGELPIGTVVAYAGKDVPEKWLECDGRALTVDEQGRYARLLKVLEHDGTTPFGAARLPDLRARFVLGQANEARDSLSKRAPGATGGTETHVLTIDEMPSHSHRVRMGPDGKDVSVNGNLDMASSGGSTVGFQSKGPFGGNTPSDGRSAVEGGGKAHENMPPFIVLKYIIKAL